MALFIQTPTQASQIRLTYAQEIAASCPDSLFTEIALTGSSARGLANEDSDIEINFWLEKLPPIEARKNWLIELGLINTVAHTEPRSDGSIWVNGTYKGIELEAGWQTIADLETSLNELITAQTSDNKKLRLAELVLSAKSLRGTGTLNHWQPILENYPETLADKLIADALSGWLIEANWLETRLATKDFEADIARIYRILFALNRRWEINWKWAHHILPELQIAPDILERFVGERHRALPNPKAEDILVLILETLALIDPSVSNRNTLITFFQNTHKKYLNNS